MAVPPAEAQDLPVPPEVVLRNVSAAHLAGDWHGVLKWEGRMEELMVHRFEYRSDDTEHARKINEPALEVYILGAFSKAHISGWSTTLSQDHVCSFVGLEERRIPLLAKVQRFRDQGEAMCRIAQMLLKLDRTRDSATWFQRARDVGAAHGFFSLESTACRGLGVAAVNEGRQKEGVELLRNSLAAAQLNEMDNPEYEADALEALIRCTFRHRRTRALFDTDAVNEVEPLVLRLREIGKAESEKAGGFSYSEVVSLLFSARLHEVIFISPHGINHCFQQGRITTVAASTAPERTRMHLLKPPFSPGTREA